MPKSAQKLTDRLKELGAKEPIYSGNPVWTGPDGEGPNGGITYSLLTRYLTCKERFRLQVVEGLRPEPSFNPVIDFGNMWHLCEESYLGDPESWYKALTQLCQNYCRQFPMQQPSIAHWYDICKTIFPIYIDHYRTWPKRKNFLREKSFNVKYTLPSGRSVRLRGKWDSVDTNKAEYWIWENKTKSSIDIVRLEKQLSFDLQTLFYVVAFGTSICDMKKVEGIVYNVIRRSAHKSTDSMVRKMEEDSANGRIQEWFWRKEIPVKPERIKQFQTESLDPILEELCIWWDNISKNGGKPMWGPIHNRRPYFRNMLEEGGTTDFDYLLDTGSLVGLTRSEELFPELST